MKKVLFFISVLLLISFVIFTKFTIGGIILAIYVILSMVATRRNLTLDEIIDISILYGKKSSLVIILFIFIGSLSATWMACGTIPGLVYYGLKFINPNIFLFFVFVICCIVSSILGSAFASTGIIGVALMAIAKTSDINLNLVGAAIISGVYFGDRWSPISVSANLVSSLTGVGIFTNLRNMVKSTIVPFILTSILYLGLSRVFTLDITENLLPNMIMANYNLDIRFIFLPLVAIIVLSILKVNVKISMGISIVMATLIAMFLQNEKLFDVLNYAFNGFYKFNGGELEKIIKGGGVVSMANATIVIVISCLLVGILEKMEILSFLKSKIRNIDSRANLFANMFGIGVISSMIGCNQTVSIIMTEQVMEEVYDSRGLSREDLTVDLENSAVILNGFIPWNSSCFVPCAILEVAFYIAIPLAFFLSLIPICTFIQYKIADRKSLK